MIESFSSEVLLIEADGAVATLWLDRPEAYNAMGPDLWADLPRAFEAIAEEPDLRAVVIAAKGKHFTVGLDLKAMGSVLAPPPAEPGAPPPSPAAKSTRARREIKRLQRAITAVADCPLPTIAAVHGHCIGGGVDLISACDIRLSSADASYSVREAKVAIVADLGSLQRLPKIIGSGHVAELAFTGKDIDATRAMQIGLVNDIYPDAEGVYKAASELALEIASNSPLAVQGTKAVLAANDGRTVTEGLDYVATWNAGALESEDLMEAMVAFIQKRPPEYKGR